MPITGVENDDEVTVSDSFPDFPTVAQHMVGIVGEIVADYPNVQIGQWQGGNPAGTTDLWWQTYDDLATIAHLPTISYAVADTSWNAPWVTSPTAWQAWLDDLSNLGKSDGVQLEVLLDGVNTDGTDEQWTAQSEQHAAMLASLSGVSVSTLLIRTWQTNHPQAVLPVNSPTTISNDVIEIAATVPALSKRFDNGPGANHGICSTSDNCPDRLTDGRWINFAELGCSRLDRRRPHCCRFAG